MNEFFNFSRYLFIFAHPDDEIYTCAFIEKLIQDGKEVHILYVTSGDYQGAEFGPMREEEVLQSAQIMSVPISNVRFLKIPERQLMASVSDTIVQTSKLIKDLKPDCIVGHDFEGGHNGHDAVSFCSSQTANSSSVPFYVFPAYHGWPENRIWNQFIASREPTDILTLTALQQNLQNRVIAVHSTQQGFFNVIRVSSSNDLFSKREVLRLVSVPMDYTQPPENPVGYEYLGNKLKFVDFKKVVLVCGDKMFSNHD